MNFGSPPKKRETSPIRVLDDRSPNNRHRLYPIIQQDHYEISRPSRLSYQTPEYDSPTSRVLLDKIKIYANQSHRTIIQNSRLSKQNQILRDNQLIGLSRMNKQISFKDMEIEKLVADMSVLKEHYQRDIERQSIENHSLKKQLDGLENAKVIQAMEIKQKYSRIADQDLNFAKRTYIDDIHKIMDALQSTKFLLLEKQAQLKDLTIVSQNISKQYNNNIEFLISENNILRNKLMQVQMKKEKEIKQEQLRKQLQKSRTNGIMSHCKQSNAYLEKEISRLANQLLEKNINIETFTKSILKMQKNQAQKQKKFENKIKKMEDDNKKQIREFEKLIAHMSKMHKDETDGLRKRQIQLRERLSTQQQENLNLRREIKHLESVVQKESNEINQLKGTIGQLHADHSKDVEKLMSDSRRMISSRRSQKSIINKMDNIGSSKEIIPIEGEPGNKKKQFLEVVEEQNSKIYDKGHGGEIAFQDAQSLGDGPHQQIQTIDQIVEQYQTRLLQAQNDKNFRLSLAQQQIDQLKRNLQSKQKETIEILQKFTPLMQMKMNDKIEQQYKQNMVRHRKADLDILDVMLNKYQIAYLSNKN